MNIYKQNLTFNNFQREQSRKNEYERRNILFVMNLLVKWCLNKERNLYKNNEGI